jgi:hypothetical protein
LTPDSSTLAAGFFCGWRLDDGLQSALLNRPIGELHVTVTHVTSISQWAAATGPPGRCSSVARRSTTRSRSRWGSRPWGGNGSSADHRLYQLIRQPQPIVSRHSKIEFPDAGAETFASHSADALALAISSLSGDPFERLRQARFAGGCSGTASRSERPARSILVVGWGILHSVAS